MIPWVREKFAELRIASRKRSEFLRNTNNTSSAGNSSNSGISIINSNSNGKNFNHESCSTTDKILTVKISSKSEENNEEQNSNQEVTEEKINVKIRSPIGKEIIIATTKTTKIINLKQEALQEFVKDSNSLPLYAADVKELYSKYRFIRPDSQIEFQEKLSVEEAGIQNNEILNLCIKRTKQVQPTSSLRGPTVTEIALATISVQQSDNRPKRTEINEYLFQADLYFDVRKVIISLAQSSAYVVGAGPYASRLIAMLKQKLINKKKYQSNTLQCLVDMGFSAEKASYSLKINNGVYSMALDWLIAHQNDDIQEDVSTNMSSSASRIFESNNCADNIESLLEIVRIYSQRYLPPRPAIVNSLTDMGFSEKDVLKALRVTRNNRAAACEWLCGKRSSSLTELRDGLVPQSPIYKIIMESPQVQMSLGNPKMFLAYLSVLENQTSLSMWLGDNETSPVLSHILRKYHEEKHILGTNQLNVTPNVSNNNN